MRSAQKRPITDAPSDTSTESPPKKNKTAGD